MGAEAGGPCVGVAGICNIKSKVGNIVLVVILGRLVPMFELVASVRSGGEAVGLAEADGLAGGADSAFGLVASVGDSIDGVLDALVDGGQHHSAFHSECARIIGTEKFTTFSPFLEFVLVLVLCFRSSLDGHTFAIVIWACRC